MSKLQELIRELCPNKLEFNKLGKVCEITIGEFVHKNKQTDKGKYPVFNGGREYTGFYDEYNNIGEKVIISARGANAGFINKVYTKYWAGNSCYSLSPLNNQHLLWTFLYYILKDKEKELMSFQQKGGIPALSKKQIEQIEIPIPPLEVQNEIVRILDAFTSHIAELQAELQGRKEQYEYYRNKLLSFDKNIKWATLNDICTKICSGGTPTTSIKEYYQGNIPWLRTQEINWTDIYDTEIKISENAVKESSAKLIPPNCVIVAMYGATAGKVCINKIPITTNQACCNLEINANIASYKYVYYWLCNEYRNLKALGEGCQSNINGRKIKSYKIPIPPLSEQQRIVSILDKFETLVNDLTEGIPAEIAAVQEQYEYYRNKLLSFPKLEA